MMQIPKLTGLGFTGQRCPVTNTVAPNMILAEDNYHISFTDSNSAVYGDNTTAIVLQNRVFLILTGDHTEGLASAKASNGLQGCIDYFIANIDQANPLSEHLMALGRNDQFALYPTALEVLGQANLDRLAKAADQYSAQI